MDQTVRFPVTSSPGSKYLMVMYNHGSNMIIPEPIKLRSESELIRAYAVLHSKLTDHGLHPNFQMLDNECPASLKNFMRREGVTFMLGPPHLHQTNSSKCAIHTFKDNLITGISRCDPGFPLHLCD